MKNILLVLLLFSIGIVAQTNPILLEKKQASTGQSINLDGSSEYASVTPNLRLTGEVGVSIASIPNDTVFASNQIYGKWSFNVSKASDLTALNIYFVNDVNSLSSNSGYYFSFGTDEKFYLYSINSGTPTARITSSATYLLNTSYLIEITRNTNGAFNLLVNGTSIGTVTNTTYTNSNYCFVDRNTSDAITGLIFEYGMGSLDLNGFERIKFSFDRDGSGATNWTGNGNHSIADSSTVDKKSGTYSMAITSSGAGDATTNYVSLASDKRVDVEAGKKYTVEAWARGTGVLGSELITNAADRDFSSDTGFWFKSSGTTISGEKANINYSGAFAQILSRFGLTSSGKTYQLTVTVTVTSGTLYVYIGTSVTNLAITTSNTYVVVGDCLNLSWLNFGAAAFVGTIDNVSFKEITKPTITLALGSQTKSVSNISCVPGTFTKLVWNFQATSNEVGQPLKMYVNQADVTYVDDVSLTQAYDALVSAWVRTTSYANYPNSVNKYTSGDVGYTISTNGSNGYPYLVISDGTTSLNTGGHKSIGDGLYHLEQVLLNRISNGTLYVDGTAGTPASIANIGNTNNANNLAIGRALSATNYWNGNIGEVQITRFNDIAASNVNASTLTQAYRNGLGTWNNGQVAAWYKFRGLTDGQMLYDWSGNGNHLSGTNLTTADMERGAYPTK